MMTSSKPTNNDIMKSKHLKNRLSVENPNNHMVKGDIDPPNDELVDQKIQEFPNASMLANNSKICIDENSELASDQIVQQPK